MFECVCVVAIISIVRDIVRNLVYIGETPAYTFDTSEPGRFVVNHENVSTLDTLREIYNRLLECRRGCCFNYASATAFAMLEQGIPCVLVVSQEGNGVRLSVGYRDDKGAFAICNPVQFVDGQNKNFDECIHIPLEDFQKDVGEIVLLDPKRIGNNYAISMMNAFKKRESNITIEEFLNSTNSAA